MALVQRDFDNESHEKNESRMILGRIILPEILATNEETDC